MSRGRDQTDLLSVTTSLIESRTLLGCARYHGVVTDRPSDGGGRDLGCTSGELLLLTVGSCVVDNIARCAVEKSIRLCDLTAEVTVAALIDPFLYEPIDVVVEVHGGLVTEDIAAMYEAAGSGRVVGRLRRNTDVRIRIVQVDEAGARTQLTQCAAESDRPAGKAG